MQAEEPVPKSHQVRWPAPAGELQNRRGAVFGERLRCEAGTLTSIVGGGWERDPASSWPALMDGVCLTMAKLLNIPPIKSITQLSCFPETPWHGKASALGHLGHISARGQQKLPSAPTARSLKEPKYRARLCSHVEGRSSSLPSPCPAQPEPPRLRTQKSLNQLLLLCMGRGPLHEQDNEGEGGHAHLQLALREAQQTQISSNSTAMIHTFALPIRKT